MSKVVKYQSWTEHIFSFLLSFFTSKALVSL